MRPPKRIIDSGDLAAAPATDVILEEIASLYRERVRALYNRDEAALQSISDRIDALKAKLSSL